MIWIGQWRAQYSTHLLESPRRQYHNSSATSLDIRSVVWDVCHHIFLTGHGQGSTRWCNAPHMLNLVCWSASELCFCTSLTGSLENWIMKRLQGWSWIVMNDVAQTRLNTSWWIRLETKKMAPNRKLYCGNRRKIARTSQKKSQRDLCDLLGRRIKIATFPRFQNRNVFRTLSSRCSAPKETLFVWVYQPSGKPPRKNFPSNQRHIPVKLSVFWSVWSGRWLARNGRGMSITSFATMAFKSCIPRAWKTGFQPLITVLLG